MEFQVDAATHSPVLVFHYPSTEPSAFDYLRRFVKMEFGCSVTTRCRRLFREHSNFYFRKR